MLLSIYFPLVTLLHVGFTSAVGVPPPAPERTLSPRAPSSWVHPGVLNSKQQLDFVKGKIAAGAQPWSSAFSAMLADPIATSTRTPHATYATVTCGPTSTPDVGCHAEVCLNHFSLHDNQNRWNVGASGLSGILVFQLLSIPSAYGCIA
jgi:hypothetical protein